MTEEGELWTQFLGAFNDNVFKFVVSMVAVSLAADLAAARLSWVGALFILPFLLFSGYAGQLADTRSKRTVLVWTKGLEVCAMLLGIAALAAGRLDGLLVDAASEDRHAGFVQPVVPAR